MGDWGVGERTWSPGGFPFNSIKGEMDGKWGMFYIFYRSCLVVNFYFSRVKILVEWGCVLKSVYFYYSPDVRFLRQNAPKSFWAGTPPQTPLGELTTLPQTP